MDPVAAMAAAAVTALVLSAAALWFAARSAAAAGRSATASEASTRAAEESVKIARAAQDREDTPAFTLRPISPTNGLLPVEITMVTGPPGIKVAAHYFGLAFGPGNADGACEGRIFRGEGPGHRPVRLIRNDSFLLYLDLIVEGGCRVEDGQITLLCEESAGEEAIGTGRRWWVREKVHWPLP